MNWGRAGAGLIILAIGIVVGFFGLLTLLALSLGAEDGSIATPPTPTRIPGEADIEVYLANSAGGAKRIDPSLPFAYFVRLRNGGDKDGRPELRFTPGEGWVELGRSYGNFRSCDGATVTSCSATLAPGEAAWLTVTGYFSKPGPKPFWAKAEHTEADGNSENNSDVDRP